MEKTWIPCIIQTSNYVLVFVFILYVCSCGNKEYNRNQVKESLTIEKQGSQVGINNKFSVKIYFKEKKYKILRAYIDCLKDNRKVDSISHRIKGCFKQLEIRNDTIRIALTPTNLGKKKFEDITVVYKDEQNRVSLIDTSFYYNVSLK